MNHCYIACKNVLKLVGAAGLLLVSSPLIALAALLVKLTSEGPAFYWQTRVGLRGKPFTFYKIRTMEHGCEENSGPAWAVPCDPRVVRFGNFLRNSHIDELPQLWHVLCGEMGLVGPRPERPEFVAKLEQMLPNYHDRHYVRPGISGLAQLYLAPDTSITSVQRKLVYDLYYVRHVNPWLDIRILVCTILSALTVPFDFSRTLLRLPDRTQIEQTNAPIVRPDAGVPLDACVGTYAPVTLAALQLGNDGGPA